MAVLPLVVLLPVPLTFSFSCCILVFYSPFLSSPFLLLANSTPRRCLRRATDADILHLTRAVFSWGCFFVLSIVRSRLLELRLLLLLHLLLLLALRLGLFSADHMCPEDLQSPQIKTARTGGARLECQ